MLLLVLLLLVVVLLVVMAEPVVPGGGCGCGRGSRSGRARPNEALSGRRSPPPQPKRAHPHAPPIPVAAPSEPQRRPPPLLLLLLLLLPFDAGEVAASPAGSSATGVNLWSGRDAPSVRASSSDPAGDPVAVAGFTLHSRPQLVSRKTSTRGGVAYGAQVTSLATRTAYPGVFTTPPLTAAAAGGTATTSTTTVTLTLKTSPAQFPPPIPHQRSHCSSSGSSGWRQHQRRRRLLSSPPSCRRDASTRRLLTRPSPETRRGLVPGPVSDLRVAALNGTAVRVTWAPPARPATGPVLSYLLRYRRVLPTSEPSRELPVPGANGTEATLTGLAPRSSYAVAVAAVSSVGTGAFQETRMVTTPDSLPGPVRALQAIPVSHTAIRLSWGPPAVPGGLVTLYSVRVRDAETGERLSYTVRVRDAAQSTLPPPISPTLAPPLTPPPPPPPPPPPTSAAPPGGSTASYDGARDVTFLIGGLRPHTRYAVEVCASTGAGEGAASYLERQGPHRMLRGIAAVPEDPPGILTVLELTARSLTAAVDSAGAAQRGGAVHGAGDTLLRLHYHSMHYHITHYHSVHYHIVHYHITHYHSMHYHSMHHHSMHYHSRHYRSMHYQLGLHYHGMHYRGMNYHSLHYHSRHHHSLHYQLGVIQAEETVAALRLTVGDLRPFTEYTAKVWAQTSVGVGPERRLIVTTSSDGQRVGRVPGPVGDLTAVGLNATAVLVQWSRPLEPNGAILRYRVLALVQGTGAIVKEVVLRERTAEDDLGSGVGPMTAYLSSATTSPSSASAASASSATTASARTAPAAFAATAATPPATPVSAATPPPAPLFPYANRRLRRAVAVEPGGGDVGDDDGSGGGGERSGLEPRGRAPTPPVPPPVPPPPLPLPRRSRRSPAALAHVRRRDAAAPGTAEQQQQLTVLGDVSGELLALAVTRLPPYSELSFSVSALTVLGEGPSVSVSAWTLQGVPSPVRAVRYETLSPTSVWVTWEPPLHPNGVLGPYTVYVTPLGDASNETRTLTTNGTAATVTGTSRRLRRPHLLTPLPTPPRAGPDSPPRNVSYVAVSPTQVNVTWLAPERPNGVVLYYEVLYRDAGAGTTAGTTAATLAVTTPSEAVALTGLRKYGLSTTNSATTNSATTNSATTSSANSTTNSATTNSATTNSANSTNNNATTNSATTSSATTNTTNSATTNSATTNTTNSATTNSATTNTTNSATTSSAITNTTNTTNANSATANSAVTNSATTIPTAAGLEVYSHYWLQVAAWTRPGQGPRSTPLLLTTDQDGERSPRAQHVTTRSPLAHHSLTTRSPRAHHSLTTHSPLAHHSLTTPPGPVLNLSCAASSWHEVAASWSAPTETNGPLSGYRLSLAVAAVPTASLLALGATWAALSWRAPALLPGWLARYSVSWELRPVACVGWEPEAAACAEATGGAVEAPADRTELRVDGLRPYRWYRFRVAAATGAGLGPASEWSAARTAVGGESAHVAPAVCHVGSLPGVCVWVCVLVCWCVCVCACVVVFVARPPPPAPRPPPPAPRPPPPAPRLPPPAPRRPVPKKSFLLHVESLCANGNLKFIDEFTELSEYGQELSTSDADLPWNQSKNRFAAIKPYNDNRVKLSPDVSVPGSDYINASYISGYHCPNELVATQGPLAGTVGDFWRMVWETGASTIAMLTACVERGRIRCHQYWPEECTPVAVFGDIVITKITESVHPEWVARELRVERVEGSWSLWISRQERRAGGGQDGHGPDKLEAEVRKRTSIRIVVISA
ncbi:unnamed protein product [Lampetra fluviatilis]